MKKLLLFALVSVLVWACNKPTNFVQINTNHGKIVIELYDETPLHRDNFQKLVTEGFYDDLLFHRVIDQFMIQGGDPVSKYAEEGQQLGSGGPGYTIPNEINASDRCFHRKGTLSAARQGDNVNPDRRSSGSQFYIVVGRQYSDSELARFEQQAMMQAKQALYQKYTKQHQEEFQSLYETGDKDALKEKQNELIQQVEAEINQDIDKYYMTLEQRAAYQELGGTPHLDNAYTVFGEVIEGLEVVEEISKVKTNNADRPLEDIKMKMKFVKR